MNGKAYQIGDFTDHKTLIEALDHPNSLVRRGAQGELDRRATLLQIAAAKADRPKIRPH
jgi:hypothetical protein